MTPEGFAEPRFPIPDSRFPIHYNIRPVLRKDNISLMAVVCRVTRGRIDGFNWARLTLEPSMLRRTLAILSAVALTACGDNSAPVTTATSGKTSVLLTDAPFPYDSVARVDVFIVSIAASTTADTMPGSQGTWTVLAAPNRAFNLIDLQNGTTALLGENTVPAGQYRAVRMIIDTDKSSVTSVRGNAIPVAWQSSTGRPTLYARVEAPVQIGSAGGALVIDFDVGRSFLCLGATCSTGLTFSPVFRAVDAGATGSISGTVRADASGGGQSVANSSISVLVVEPPLAGDSGFINAQRVAATGKTDAQGHYKVAYLLPGTYQVHADPPSASPLFAGDRTGITVAAGRDVVDQDVTLPKTDALDIDISLPGATLSVRDSIRIEATVRTSSGTPIRPQLSWSSSNDAVLHVVAAGQSAAIVMAQSVGTATVTVAYQQKSATATFVVNAAVPPQPVATITLDPADLTAFVGDSVPYRATLRDATGRQLFNRSVAWSVSDAAVANFIGSPQFGQIRALAVGKATVTAASEGKQATTTLTVKAK
jgi:hypothetical protein